jgi:hypothetical protein
LKVNKKILVFTVFVFAASAVYAADMVRLESVRASDFGPAGRVSCVENIPVPAAPRMAETVSPDLLAKFNDTDKQLSRFRDELTWVGGDLDGLEGRARQIIQYNLYDPSFQSDLSRMSSDMSRRFETIRQLSADVKTLLNLAQSSPELNTSARNMEASAREILRLAWPALQDSAGRLEGTISSGKPQIIGYDSQWTAGDISRYTRQISDQARTITTDTKKLVTATQP